jgi:allantoin racemase
MKILLINSNTSQVVTDKVAAGARAVASPGTEILAVCGDFGARVIGTRSEEAIAHHSTIALAARHAEGCDAAIIAVSYDTGLRGTRELLDIPVVGMTEAALLTACMLGGRMGLITFGARGRPVYEELVASYGLTSRIAGWRTVESTAAYQPGFDDELEALLVREAISLVEREFADTVVLTGAVMAGVGARIQSRVPVPVLDGIAAGVPQAELLARARWPKPTRGSYAAPGARELVNVDAAIAKRFTP